MNPTAEQAQCVDLFTSGLNLVIQAGAGTGKTTVLRMMAEGTPRVGQFVSFNKSVANDAAKAMPSTVRSNTAHSLAFRAVGRRYSHRLGGARMRSMDVARLLKVDPMVVDYDGVKKVLQPSYLGSLVMRAVGNFCFSDAPEPSSAFVPYIPGIDPADEMGRGWENNRLVRHHLEPAITRAWADQCDPAGRLRFSHDCQPPGTLVRRVSRAGGHDHHSGDHWSTEWEDVPIEEVQIGDQVVSFTNTARRGYVRRRGRNVTAAGQRDYRGDMVTVTTASGRQSSYTADHRCIVRLDCDLSDGNFIVYLARKGENFRVGRTTWRTRSQNNSLGLRRRAEGQRADAMWVLSVHASDQDAALAEALAAHLYHLPTWQFRAPHEVMPLAIFWEKIGPNRAEASACLHAHGLDVRFPFWEKGDGWANTRRPLELRARNLLAGMMMLEPDEIKPGDKGELYAYDGTNGWSPITVSRSHYEGPVFSLDVDTDHTYVADGIVTHNCYLKIWQLSQPHIDADYLLLDEAQDSSPVLLDVFEQQTDLQRVAVGDSSQQLYSWRGALDALAKIDADAECVLSQSFRFGPAIAAVANRLLAMLDAPLRLVGLDSIDSRVGPVDRPDCILCRTNAVAMRTVLRLLAEGRRVHLVGGGDEIVRFARAAQQLRTEGYSTHPELACFTSWGEVVDWVEQDPAGDELALLVKLVEEFGPEAIVEGLEATTPEELAEVIVSTAHRGKGREWPTVALAEDFPEFRGEPDPEELRLLYVACTRARLVLDVTACAPMRTMLGEDAARPVLLQA